MKFLLLAIALTVSASSFALESFNYESSNGKLIKMTDSTVEKLWNEGPACLKRGGKMLKVNKAFKAKGLKASDCSATDNAKEEQKLLGYSVNVIKLKELSPSMVKQFGI